MASRHRRSAPRPIVVAAAGAGLGAFVLAGPATGFAAQALAKTIIVVGGANDPTGKDQWKRIGSDYTGPPPVFVPYSAQFGIGWPGFALSQDRKTTYAQSVSEGADATVKAIVDAKSDPAEDVVVYTISQGSDVVGLAVLRYGKDHPAPTTGGGKLTLIEQGGPSFIRTGMWNVIPAGIPGLHTGPIRNDGASGATVVGICIKGDIACGVGNPISSMFYALPGFMLHGSGYTAEYIGRYSPVTGEAFTPGSTPEVPVKTEQVFRDGRMVTEDTYADGSTKRTWVEDNATWVVIDTGENPWLRMIRANGTPIPKEFDKLLNALVPIPEPGARTIFSPPSTSATDVNASESPAVPGAPSTSGEDPKHGADRPDGVSVKDLVSKVGGSITGGATRGPDTATAPVTERDPAVDAPTGPEAPTTPETPTVPEDPETPITPAGPETPVAPANPTGAAEGDTDSNAGGGSVEAPDAESDTEVPAAEAA